MLLASLDRWHPIRLCLYCFLAAALLGALYCLAPSGNDPQGRSFRGLLAVYAAYLCAIAIVIPNLRRQGLEAYSQLLSRVARIRGFDRPQAFSFERDWFAVTACFTGLSFLIPLYVLSKIILSWSEIGWPDVVVSTLGMVVGLVFVGDFYFLLRKRSVHR